MQLFGLDKALVENTLKSEAGKRKGDFAKRNKAFGKYDRLVFLQHYGGKDRKTAYEFSLNDGFTEVQNARGLIEGREISVFCHSLGPASAEEDKKKSEVERWMWGVVAANEDRQETNPLKDAILDALQYGWGAVLSYWDPAIAEASMQSYGEQMVMTDCPIVLQRLSPKTIYPEMGYHLGKWRSHLIIEKKSVAEAEEQFGVELPSYANQDHDKKISHEIECVHYFGWERVDDKWQVVEAAMAGKDLVKEPNVWVGYSSLPITIFFGIPTTNPEWEYMGLPVIFPLMGAIEAGDELVNAVFMQVRRATNLPLIQTKKRGGGAEVPPQFEEGLFKVITVEEGENIGFPVWPGNPPDVNQLSDFIRSQRIEGSISPLPQTASASGIATQRRWEQSLTKILPIQNSIERSLRGVFRKAQELTISFAPDTDIYLVSRYPKISEMASVNGAELAQYSIDVRLAGDLPMDLARKMSLALQIAALGPRAPVSAYWQLENLWNVEQPEEEQGRKDQEELRRNSLTIALAAFNQMVAQGMQQDQAMQMIQGVMGQKTRQSQEGKLEEPPSSIISPYETGPTTANEDMLQELTPRGPQGEPLGPVLPGGLEE